MTLFVDGMVGKDFVAGLAHLKALAESPEIAGRVGAEWTRERCGTVRSFFCTASRHSRLHAPRQTAAH